MDDLALLESLAHMLEYNPYHGADGRFTDEASAKTAVGLPGGVYAEARNILKKTRAFGGSTTDGRGHDVTSGIMVGDPRFGRGVPRRVNRGQQVEEIARYLMANQHLLVQGRKVGTWLDDARNIHLDMPKRYTNVKKAARAGHKLHELSVADVAKGLATGWEQGVYATSGPGWAKTMRELGLVRKLPKVHGPVRGRIYHHREGVDLTLLPQDVILWTLSEGQAVRSLAVRIVEHYAQVA